MLEDEAHHPVGDGLLVHLEVVARPRHDDDARLGGDLGEFWEETHARLIAEV